MEAIKPELHNLLKKYLYTLLKDKFLYILSFLFFSFCLLVFFIFSSLFTADGKTDLHSFFSLIPYVCILVIPALGSLFINKGEENYLPFSSLKIILTKNLSLNICFLLFFLFPTIVIPVSVSFLGNVELAPVLCAYLGLILFALLSFSFVIFFNALIYNNGIAFLINASFLFVLVFSYKLSIYFPNSVLLNFFTKVLSFYWHFDSFSKGILDSRDILYFLIFTTIFTFLTFLVIKKRAENKSPLKKVCLVFFVTLLLFYVDFTHFYFRIDTTQAKEFTVSEYSKTLLSEISEPISFYFYRSRSLKNLYPQINDVEEYLNHFTGESSFASLNIIDPKKSKDSLLEAKLLNLGIEKQTIKSYSEEEAVYSCIVIEYVGETEVIPLVLNTDTLEFDLDFSLEHLIRNFKPTVQVIAGNGYSLENDYSLVIPWLKTKGFNVIQTYFPSESDGLNKPAFSILENIPLVLLGSAHATYEDAQALKAYINNGGKALLFTSPFTVDLENNWEVINSYDQVCFMLSDYGIYFSDSLLCDKNCYKLLLEGENNSSESISYTLWPSLLKQKNALNGLNTYWPVALETDQSVSGDFNLALEKSLYTSAFSWIYEKTDDSFITNPFLIPQSPEENSLYKSYAVAVKAFREKDLSFILTSDQYMLHSSFLTLTYNDDYDVRAYNYLTDNLLLLYGKENLLSLKNKNVVDKSLYKIKGKSILKVARNSIFICLAFDIIYLAFVRVLFLIYRKKIQEKFI